MGIEPTLPEGNRILSRAQRPDRPRRTETNRTVTRLRRPLQETRLGRPRRVLLPSRCPVAKCSALSGRCVAPTHGATDSAPCKTADGLAAQGIRAGNDRADERRTSAARRTTGASAPSPERHGTSDKSVCCHAGRDKPWHSACTGGASLFPATNPEGDHFSRRGHADRCA